MDCFDGESKRVFPVAEKGARVFCSVSRYFIGDSRIVSLSFAPLLNDTVHPLVVSSSWLDNFFSTELHVSQVLLPSSLYRSLSSSILFSNYLAHSIRLHVIAHNTKVSSPRSDICFKDIVIYFKQSGRQRYKRRLVATRNAQSLVRKEAAFVTLGRETRAARFYKVYREFREARQTKNNLREWKYCKSNRKAPGKLKPLLAGGVSQRRVFFACLRDPAAKSEICWLPRKPRSKATWL